jgi:S-adenosylmethionine:tRNA ribosyltransferase-isomerase
MKGVVIAPVTLDVGPGTFLPVKTDEVEEHVMHSERYIIPEESSREIESAKAYGRRVICVGTTAVRTLECAASCDVGAVRVRPGRGSTDIFIYPGFDFKVCDALITNFHLPRSTLLMLVSAFAGRELILKTYAEAIEQRYNFFSYGDAMFIE